MNTAYQHLGLTPGIIDNFALQANLVVDEQMKRTLERRIRELSRISDRVMEGESSVAPKETVDKVMVKVRHFSRRANADYEEWSPIELRILSYNLAQLSSVPTAFDYALLLLERNWRTMFFNGLMFFLLNNWLSQQPAQRDSVSTLVKRKLEEYDGVNSRYLSWKNHANFFDANGPLRVATLLSHQSVPVMNAPKLLGYKESVFAFPYFSDVILHYFAQSGTIDVSVLEQVFALHQLDRTKKLMLAMMVDHAEKEASEPLQTQVSKFAQAILGDIALSSTWTPFPNANEEEIVKLKKSQALVNQWNARKAINTFFELCVQDSRRKELWLKYVPFIYDFRIVGSRAIRTKLLCDERIGDLIGNYFIATNSSRGQTSALVLYISSKVFVEFSDKGALYVYDSTHYKISGLTKRGAAVSAVDDLKLPSINLLIDGFMGDGSWYHGYESQSWITYHDQGRLLHSDYWRERINAWMRQKLHIDYKHPNDNKPPVSTLPSIERHDHPEKSASTKPIAISKRLFGGICRVEAFRDGLYLRICDSDKLHRLIEKDFTSTGNIWIKKEKDYEQVYYHTSDNDEYLGFLTFWDYTRKEIRFYPLFHDTISVYID